jgi:hypothetical protein
VRFVAGIGVSGEFPERIDIMSDDGLSDRRRASEEEYFRKRDQQLVEHARIQAEREAARDRLSQRVGVADDEVLQHLESLGFSDRTVSLLHLLPLVHIGWVDGGISASVARRIMEAAREHGIEELSEAGHQLREWLERRPSDVLFDGALRAIKAILQHQSFSERERYVRNLLKQSTDIAGASGGVIGFGKISNSERAILDHLRHELEAAASD